MVPRRGSPVLLVSVSALRLAGNISPGVVVGLGKGWWGNLCGSGFSRDLALGPHTEAFAPEGALTMVGKNDA